MPAHSPDLGESTCYRLVVAGRPEWQHFDGRYHRLVLEVGTDCSPLTLHHADQTALFALLRQVRDLGLQLLLVERQTPDMEM